MPLADENATMLIESHFSKSTFLPLEDHLNRSQLLLGRFHYHHPQGWLVGNRHSAIASSHEIESKTNFEWNAPSVVQSS
jgi:hypothetical protein